MADELEETIDPTDLEAETVRGIQYAVNGYVKEMKKQDRDEMTDYQRGKLDAYSNVMGMLTRFLEEIDDHQSGEN